MADNTLLNPGSGGDTIRDLNRLAVGVKTQVMQLDLGGVSANAEVLITAGQKTMANSVPVTMAADQPQNPFDSIKTNLQQQILQQQYAVGISGFVPFPNLLFSR